MKMITAASAARLSADFHVGGVFIRLSRALIRACFFLSSAETRRPVRPRASIEPAAFPRCLVRRLRFVWATVLPRIEQLFDRCAVAERYVRREVFERLPRGERDEFGARDRGVSPDRRDDL